MILENKDVILAYRCPECGCFVKSAVGLFSLSGDMFRLKCSCGGSSITVEKMKDKKIRVTIPCFICEMPHSYPVSESIFFERDLFAFNCSYSGIDLGFVGKEEKVNKAIEDADKILNEMIDEDGLCDEEDCDCCEHDGEDYDCDCEECEGKSVLDDPENLNIITYVLSDLIESGSLYCGCPGFSEPEEGQYEISANEEYVTVACKKCGCSTDIRLMGESDKEYISSLTELELE